VSCGFGQHVMVFTSHNPYEGTMPLACALSVCQQMFSRSRAVSSQSTSATASPPASANGSGERRPFGRHEMGSGLPQTCFGCVTPRPGPQVVRTTVTTDR